MKIGVIISSNDAETSWNALRYANFCLGQKDEVKVFFTGKGVEYQKISTDKFNTIEQAEKGKQYSVTALQKSLERGKTTQEKVAEITDVWLLKVLGERMRRYDKGGEQFYDTISALHKSVRGSDPDAALYWLGRMLSAGEDPLYIARRMIRFASEDIGLAQPTALVVANDVFRAVEIIGLPECGINLVHGVA